MTQVAAPRWSFVLAGVFLLAPWLLTAVAFAASGDAPGDQSPAYGRLPLSFEINRGQAEDRVRFLSRGPGYTLLLTDTEVILLLRRASEHVRPLPVPVASPEAPLDTDAALVRVRLVGASSAPRVLGLEELPGKVHYFVGNDRTRWRTGIPTYAHVEYREVYPGVNLVYYGNQGHLEYDFVVAPGIDPTVIRLAVEGADRLETDAHGNLLLHVGSDRLHMHKPVVYQEVGGRRREVPAAYALGPERQVAFRIGAHDPGHPLVIDPVLSYSTYLGGVPTMVSSARSIAVDPAGHAYVTGNVFDLFGGAQGFVTKLNPSGSQILYTTVLGGPGRSFPTAIALGPDGSAYVGGHTSSDAFPTLNALQPARAGDADGFVSKLDANGILVYSTYLGGSSFDAVYGIAVDAGGSATVAGETSSAGFPVVPAAALQPTHGGGRDAFVARLDPTGFSLVYSTFLGGAFDDLALSTALGPDGSVLVTGQTFSGPTFPVTHALPNTFPSAPDAFVSKVTPDGLTLSYSVRLGGSQEEAGTGIAVDGAGNAYVTGWTSSPNFPAVDAAQPFFALQWDAFVTKLGPSGTIVYSTFLGGSDEDRGTGIAVDTEGRAHVTGFTLSLDFPTVDPVQPSRNGMLDAFVAKLSPDGGAFEYSTYLGGSGGEATYPVALLGVVPQGLKPDPAIAVTPGGAYVAGLTGSFDFPTTPGVVQPSLGTAFGAAFVTRILGSSSALGSLAISMADAPDPVGVGNVLVYTLAVENSGPDPVQSVFLHTIVQGAAVRLVLALADGAVCGQIPAVVLTIECGRVQPLSPREGFLVRIVITPGMPGTITATATLHDPFAPPGQGAAVVGVSTTVPDIPPPASGDLFVFKFPGAALPGETLTYIVDVWNFGSTPAPNVTLVDLLPAGVTFVRAEPIPPATGSCTEASGIVTCQLGTLPVPQSAPVRVAVEVRPAQVGTFVNTAVVGGGVFDFNLTNNVATATGVVGSADTSPPVITPTVNGTLGSDGWYVSNVVVTWTLTDPESAVSSSFGCGPVTIVADTPGTTLTCTASSAGGTASASVTLKRDATPPTATASVSPGPNLNGWNNTDVVVSFSGTDILSGIDACSLPITLGGEGPGQSASGICRDKAGNVTTVTAHGINIDKTSPTVACGASPNRLWPPNHTLVPVTVTLTVTDLLSGPNGFILNTAAASEGDAASDIQEFTVGTADTNGLLRAERTGSSTDRVYTLAYLASDLAGNPGTCQASITAPHDESQ